MPHRCIGTSCGMFLKVSKKVSLGFGNRSFPVPYSLHTVVPAFKTQLLCLKCLKLKVVSKWRDIVIENSTGVTDVQA